MDADQKSKIKERTVLDAHVPNRHNSCVEVTVLMLAYLFVALGILVHVVGSGHTFGFTPLGASLLFFGANRSLKEFILLLPALIGADIYLNYRVYGHALQPDQWFVFAWYVGACFLGSLLKGRVRPLYVGGAALASSVSFFLVSNFAVWAVWTMYPKTFAGLIACYVAAIPFFQKGIASDLLFAAVFFSVPVLVAHFSRAGEQRRTAI
jgi:hypothetical protein